MSVARDWHVYVTLRDFFALFSAPVAEPEQDLVEFGMPPVEAYAAYRAISQQVWGNAEERAWARYVFYDAVNDAPAFLFKESNNGTTYILSIYALPWLASNETYRTDHYLVTPAGIQELTA